MNPGGVALSCAGIKPAEKPSADTNSYQLKGLSADISSRLFGSSCSNQLAQHASLTCHWVVHYQEYGHPCSTNAHPCIGARNEAELIHRHTRRHDRWS
jgi:hypothetical protein